MSEARRYRYNDQNPMNQINHRNSWGPETLDDNEFAQYILSFDTPETFVRLTSVFSAASEGF